MTYNSFLGKSCNCYFYMLSHREAGEELQMAEVKLAMHKEMLDKDEVCLNGKKNMCRLKFYISGDNKPEGKP